MAEGKDVIFTLKAVADPNSGQVVSAFATTLKNAQAEIVTSERSGIMRVMAGAAQGAEEGTKRTRDSLGKRKQAVQQHYQELLAAERAYQDQMRQMAAKLQGAMDKAKASGRPEDANAVASLSGESAKLLKEHEQVQAKLTQAQRIEVGRRVQTDIQAQRAQEEAARASLAKRLAEYKKVKAAEIKELDRTLAEAARKQAKAYEAQQRQLEKEQADKAKAAQKQRDEDERHAARSLAAHQKRQAQEVRASEQAAARLQQLQEKHRGHVREIMETAGESSEAIMKIMRGTVALGLVGERDLAKVQDALLKTQAAFDLVSGSVKIVLNIEKALYAWRNAALATAAAQDILTASTGRTAAAAAASGLAGAAGSIGGGMFSSAASRAASQKAAEVAALKQAAMLGTGGGSKAVAAGAGAAVGSAATTSTGASVLTGVVGPIIGLTAAITYLATLVRGRGEIRQESLVGRFLGGLSGVAGRLDQGLGLNTAARRAADSTDATSQAEKRTAEAVRLNNEAFKRSAELSAEILSLRQQEARVVEERLSAELGGLEPMAKRVRMAKAVADSEAAVKAKLEEGKRLGEAFEGMRAVNAQEAASLWETYYNRIKQAQQVETEIAAQLKETARQKLQSENEILRTIEQQLKTEKDKYRTAEERFALMNAGEQAEILRLQKKIDTGKSLTGDELQKLSPFRDLPGFNEKFDQTVSDRAKAAGFSAIGGDAAASIKAAEEKLKAQQEIVAKIETEINFTIDADSKKVQKALADELDKALREFMKPIVERVGKLEGELSVTVSGLKRRANGG